MTINIKFLLWLLLLFSASFCHGSELDIQCLKSVQKSVADPNGILKSSWKLNSSGVSGYICESTGVECWSHDQNRVLSLRLSSLGLQGPFPKGLDDCTSTIALDLSGNRFSGPIPSRIAHDAPHLSYLDLSNNGFSGEIPDSIADMVYHNVLNLEHNRLDGPIPERFNALGRLTTLSVADNLLSGSIPALLRKFPASHFAGNQGLCGAPLERPSGGRRVRGGLLLLLVLYFPRWLGLSKRLRASGLRV
ncbi:inactive LRR receptor-like serine/threonine-protein kinase BIR2 [Hordeum vulgare subsp. vulgare]|nr:inactive LRR receptor-like serine/threonine-protein kinase BIR2 [Hordeum vulgare subsp. vulgare]